MSGSPATRDATRAVATPEAVPETDAVAVRRALDQVVLQSLRGLSLVTAVIFLLFIAADAFSLSGMAQRLLPVLDAVVAMACIGLHLAIRRGLVPNPWAHAVGSGMMLIALLYLWIVLLLTDDSIQTSGQALWVIVACIFLLSWRWTIFLVTVANVGWLLIVTTMPPSPDWLQFWLLLASSTAIGLVAHGVRLRTHSDLIRLGLAEQRQRRDLEEALRRARAGDQAKASAQLRTRFVNDAAHQLSTPLTPLVIQASLLSQRAPQLDPETQRSVASIERNTSRLRAIVARILEAATMEAGLLALQARPFDLDAAVAAAVTTLNDEVAAQGLSIKVSGKAGAANGDEGRCTEVLRQLLSNAIAASANGGSIELSLSSSPPQVTVADHGRGIAADELLLLFQPFSRLESSTGGTGYGLGLYLSRGIVARMGGHLSCTSEGRGRGARFVLQLKPAQQPPPGVNASTPPPPARRPPADP